MSDDQVAARRIMRGKWSRLAFLTAVATAILVYRLALPGEGPRAAVLFLECIFLAGSVIGLGGSLVLLMLSW